MSSFLDKEKRLSPGARFPNFQPACKRGGTPRALGGRVAWVPVSSFQKTGPVHSMSLCCCAWKEGQLCDLRLLSAPVLSVFPRESEYTQFLSTIVKCTSYSRPHAFEKALEGLCLGPFCVYGEVYGCSHICLPAESFSGGKNHLGLPAYCTLILAGCSTSWRL